MSIDVRALTDRRACVVADEADPLAHFRQEFSLPEGVIYLDGNSLGARPVAAAARAAAVLEQEWGHDLIGSWNKHHWFELPSRIGEKICRLIGGSAGGCVVTDTTSINVFKALAAALRIQRETHPERRVIISERENFPTDIYMVQGLIELLGEVEGARYELRLVDDVDSLRDVLGDDVAVTLLTHVNYRTGRMWEMTGVTEMVHSAGSLMIWDLCHSAGAVSIDLTRAGADFAVGCTYKYLNGGPGAPAFIWAAEQHIPRAWQPLSGWWGHLAPFAMAEKYEPAAGIERFLCGTQPILSMATMEVGVDLALAADHELVRAKSLDLTSLFIQLVEDRIPDFPLTLITPREVASRGSHVSFRHPHGFAVMNALIDNGVIGDYREPEVLRFGITPLYLGYADIWDAVDILRRVLEEELWRAPEYQRRGAVT